MAPCIQKLLILGLFVLILLSCTSFILPNSGIPSFRQDKADVLEGPPIYNTTLGFQKVFALALPDRADRTVPLLDAANATNITLTVLDAVRDEQIAQDSWPPDWAKYRQPERGELGCFISYLRTWKKIIVQRISTALVMESDSDWDMRVKDIMTGVAEGAQNLVDWPFQPSNDIERFGAPFDPSPYGDNWDIVWIGHCDSSNYGNGRIYAINDTSVPPEDHEHTFASGPQDAVCSTGYAISYAGAVKIVEYFKEAQDNLDLELMAACRDRIDMACIGVWPQIITAASSHSNINHGDGAVAGGQDIDVAEVHAGPALQYSARINAEVVKKGLGQENWHPEWNTTWAMVHDEWTVVSFQEAKDLEQVATWESEIDGRSNGTRSW